MKERRKSLLIFYLVLLSSSCVRANVALNFLKTFAAGTLGYCFIYKPTKGIINGFDVSSLNKVVNSLDNLGHLIEDTCKESTKKLTKPLKKQCQNVKSSFGQFKNSISGFKGKVFNVKDKKRLES